jgi:hypothetical protein
VVKDNILFEVFFFWISNNHMEIVFQMDDSILDEFIIFKKINDFYIGYETIRNSFIIIFWNLKKEVVIG